MKWYYFLLLFGFVSCTNEQKVTVLGMENLLHDESSKVWMIVEDQVKGEEFAPENNNFKTILIFYKTGKFAEQALNTVGNRQPLYGTYRVQGENDGLTFTVSNRANTFEVVSYTKEKIVLQTDEAKLVMVPLPEL